MSAGLPEVEVAAGALVIYRPPKSSLVLSAIRALSVFSIDRASMWVIDVTHRSLAERGDAASVCGVAAPITLDCGLDWDLALSHA